MHPVLEVKRYFKKSLVNKSFCDFDDSVSIVASTCTCGLPFRGFLVAIGNASGFLHYFFSFVL
jgi:hypothetical protein